MKRDSSLKGDEFILFKFCDTTNNNFQKIFLNKHRIIINNTGYLIMFEIRIFFSRQFHLVTIETLLPLFVTQHVIRDDLIYIPMLAGPSVFPQIPRTLMYPR